MHAIDEKEVLGAILTSKPDWRPWRPLPVFDADDLEEDLNRIAALYREHGYYDATAESTVHWNDEHDRARIVIHVKEGEPVRLESWHLVLPEHVGPEAGLPADWRAQLLALIPANGSIFGVDAYRRVRQAVLDRMGDLGHPAATLEGGADVDTARRIANVSWTLQVGPTVRIGAISLSGLVDVGERVVRRELTVVPGDRYSRKALVRSQRRVFDTGLFRSVSIQPVQSDAAKVQAQAAPDEASREVVWPLEVRVVERSPRTFGVGVGYGTEDKFRARVDWTHRNFLGNGRRLSANAKYSSLIAGGQLTLSQAWFLHPWIQKPLGLEVSLIAVRDNPRAYAANRFGEKVELTRYLGHDLTFRFGQAFEWADVTSQKTQKDLSVELPDKVRLHTLPFGLRFSHLDDPLDPHLGAWLDLDVEPSLEAIGSEVDYVKLVGEARGFLPLGPVVLAARYRMGTLEPFAGTENLDIPKFKRFFAGGSTSVRGFGYQKLGPRDDEGNPLGGLSWAEGSLELRIPIWKQLKGVVFSDAGQVNLRPSDWRTHPIYYSSGLGLRLGTPVGPLRFDVARIYNPPRGADRYGFYISVGHAF